ncbi:bacteriocin-like protein [Pedobacter nototheniae]|uniref:bacteriocin-like protein n=1 Tax=Pedobacter nototheniae TaxID=2488994 RepID=UPI00292EEC72|nr:hypothetical protein [Pedobacter nototheniae]
MKNFKKLSRTELKEVIGGGPFSPSLETGDCSYKCCWNNQPSNCSATVTMSQGDSGTASCIEGAHLVAVGG